MLLNMERKVTEHSTVTIYFDRETLNAIDTHAKILGIGRGQAIKEAYKRAGLFDSPSSPEVIQQAFNIEFLLNTLDWIGGTTRHAFTERAIDLGVENVSSVIAKLIAQGKIRVDGKLLYRPKFHYDEAANLWCHDLLEYRRENGTDSFFPPEISNRPLPERFASYVLASLAARRQQIDSPRQDPDTPALPPASSTT